MFFEFLHRPPYTLIERMKYRDFIKSMQGITDGEIVSMNPDPLNKKKNDETKELCISNNTIKQDEVKEDGKQESKQI